MRKQSKIKVNGIVQGVGFRPFCYRTATKLGLTGRVLNTGDAGVEITLEGKKKDIQEFVNQLKNNSPPLSEIKNISIEWSKPTKKYSEFKIKESKTQGKGDSSIIPPDTGLCDDCLQELFNPNNRRYQYPFITCVNCGPRFTIIKKTPYDRERTTMEEFPLCEKCREEYEDPSNRRYHAEPNCCPECGPKITLKKTKGREIETNNPLKKAAELLDEGNILGIKGSGGFHVATKTTDDKVLERLREKFNRPHQPLAIMSRDSSTVKRFAEFSDKEEELLCSHQRPIMVLREKSDSSLSNLVAPGLDSVGVMLPYSGIHYILLEHGSEPAYVMTSGNLPGLPMAITNSRAESDLGDLVDYFVFHDREIENRCDDSVMKLVDGEAVFLRRSRGFVPKSIKINSPENSVKVLGLGPELDVVSSVLVGSEIYSSQYVGDVDKLETLNYLENASKNLLDLLGIQEVDYVSHDLHPEYSSTRLAEELSEELGGELIPIQHHEAHIYSLMADQKVNELVGITTDGAGYGEDGSIWGGEILAPTQSGFKRTGGLIKQPMPGGDQATIHPIRMLIGILWNRFSEEEIRSIIRNHCSEFVQDENELNLIFKQLEKNINVPETSSTGRILDAISCLLGVCGERTYEGEPAIKLEATARNGDSDRVELKPSFVEENDLLLLDTTNLLEQVLEALKNGARKSDIAAASQKALARGLGKIAIKTAREENISKVGGSGGVFYNDAITRHTREIIQENDLEFVRHKRVPPGDGGISVGQVYGVTQIT